MAAMKSIDFKKQLAVSTANTLKNNKLISSENIKNNIVILEELKNFIPSINPEEYDSLEQSIIANGCRTPLLIWNTTQGVIDANSANPDEPAFVLFDGHHRYEICRKHGIDFQIDLMSFASKEEVKDFMIDFQVGRRNMTPEQLSYLRGLKYQRLKSKQGGARLTAEDGTSFDTAEKLADEFKVSTATIKRDAVFVEGLDKIATELKNDILAGTTKVDKKAIQQLAKTAVDTPVTSVDELQRLTTKKGLSSQASKSELATTVNERVRSSEGMGISLEISGGFLINNDLVAIWKQLRGLSEETIIDLNYRDYISLAQAEAFGIVSKL